MLLPIEGAIQAARAAGQLLLSNFNNSHQVTFKGRINIVTEMDQSSERLLCESLRSHFPDYSILGEENGQVFDSKAGRWIIDPLDGTTNYSKSYPLFAVSIALEKQGEIVAGVVYNPILNEMYTAEKGKGAYLNEKQIKLSQTLDLGNSVLASGFPYDAWSNPANNCKEWASFIQKTISVRCDGVASLDLCHVAAGRLDGYWELDLEPWDMAAGALIVQEAGGCVSLCSGERFDPYHRSILASNGHLHPLMLEVLKV